MKIKAHIAYIVIAIILFTGIANFFTASTVRGEEESPYFELQVIDSLTGKGIPMTEVYRSGLIRFVTDSEGRIAINEPDLLNQSVYFDIKSDGYKPYSNNSLNPGFTLKVVPGGNWQIKLSRNDPAVRIYRLTGSGIYRDSIILGYKAPIQKPMTNGNVASHDSILVKNQPLTDAQSIVYKGKIYWFFNGLRGIAFSQQNYKMAVAISDLPNVSGVSPEIGVNLEYILNSEGFPKEMAPFGDKSDKVWFDSVVNVPDLSGGEKLVAHYIILDSKNNKKEHGLAVYNDQKQEFEKIKTFDSDEEWRYPQGRSTKVKEDGKEWIYFSDPFPNLRVPATFEAIQDPASYEAWTCYKDDKGQEVMKDNGGKPVYRWAKDAPPVRPSDEKSLIRKKIIDESEAMFLPKDKEGNQIEMLSGSVHYNEWREKWVFIGSEYKGTPSPYGQVWYSESESLVGPWEKAVKVASHNENSFFNAVHDEFFNQAKGRVLYFHGLYTKDLSSNTIPMPLYEGNYVMYRLELNNRDIEAVFKPMDKELTEVETYEPYVIEQKPGDNDKDKKSGSGKLIIILIATILVIASVAIYVANKLRRR